MSTIALLRRTGIASGIALCVSLATGCGGPKTGLSVRENPRAAYTTARSQLDEGKCREARETLRKLSLEQAGVTYIDSIVYDLARAYTCEQDYTLAKLEYERVVNSYPQSALVDDAAFGLAMSQYRQAPRNPGLDQQETERARSSLRDFIAIYPRSERRKQADSVLTIIEQRLARKTFDNGRLYLKLGADSAAMLYFQQLWDEYTQSPYAPRALWLLADKARKKEQWELAIKRYEQLIAVYPDAVEVPRARVFLERIKTARGQDLFRDAEQARSAGDLQTALDLYRQLVDRFPDDRHADEARRQAEELRREVAGESPPASVQSP